MVRYAYFVKTRVRYVGTLFELKIPDFSHNSPAFLYKGNKQLKSTLSVWIEIADL